MTRFAPTLPSPPRVRRANPRASLRVEQLESRDTPSSAAPFVVNGTEANDTLDTAQPLGNLTLRHQVRAVGTIGDGASGLADVDWYGFTLSRTAKVVLSATGSPAPIISLYNTDPDDFGDPFNPAHARPVAQSADGSWNLTVTLGPGTYYAVVSGEGNRYFHPFLAGSGTQGEGVDYTLTVAATDIHAPPSTGPKVVSADPGAGAVLGSSPFAIRVAFDAPLDPGTISPDQTVRVLYNATGNFGDGTDQSVALAGYNLSTSGQELQLFPAAALKPGYYKVALAGNASGGAPVLASPQGVAIGTDAAHPHGRNSTFTFQVTGIEGRPASDPGDDTLPFAEELDELAPGAPIQVTGAIGDDPHYDPTHPDAPLNPSADVDLYHFQITGPGQFAFTAEALAGRFGSPLDTGLSLFKFDPVTGQLQFIAGNNDTRNASVATNGTLPLHSDSALFEGLTEGDYYVAVSANYNTPTMASAVGTNGVFDPNVAHSGSAGFSTGPYVLNLSVRADNDAPTVAGTSLVPGATLTAPPTALVVDFSEPMNLQQLVFSAFEQASQETVTAVYLEAADGTRYFARFQSYNAITNRATFLMLDGTPNGEYQLHLSGAFGLTDFAGNPLSGNDPSGDYVVSFTVAGPTRGVNGDPLTHATDAASDPSQPQELGPVFPHEFQSGVTVTRATGATASDTADAVRFEILQAQTYGFTLTGTDLPAGVYLELVDGAGNAVPYGSADGNRLLTATLGPGTYVLRATGWTADEAPLVAYELGLKLLGVSDNPPPLTVGPTAAVRLTLGSVPPVDDGQGNRPLFDPGTQVPPPPASSPTAPTGGPATATADSIKLPVGLLSPLASQPLGGGENAVHSYPATEPERVSLQLPKVTPELLATLTTFIETLDAKPEVAPMPSVAPATSAPLSDVVLPPAAPVVAASQFAVTPIPAAPGSVALEAPASSPPERSTGEPAPTPVEAANEPLLSVAEEPDESALAAWDWLGAVPITAVPLLVVWQRSRVRARSRTAATIEG